MNALAPSLQSDGLSATVSLLLLAMSVASWSVILYKSLVLWRALRDVARGSAAFWQATDLARGVAALRAEDRSAVLLPLAQALQQSSSGTLAAQADVAAQRTRVLRDALHGVLHRLHAGQVLLATVGSTAPFVGLLGTVWGIYHALGGIASAGQLTIEQVAGPVGEALVMTAAGLVVALPAVLAYNVMGRAINRLEQALEGFAHDLRDL